MWIEPLVDYGVQLNHVAVGQTKLRLKDGDVFTIVDRDFRVEYPKVS